MDRIEAETRNHGQVVARRNYLLAVWAGRQLDLKAGDLPAYVDAVMQSDFEEPGPHDVVRKLEADFRKRGKPVDRHKLLRQLITLENSARAELLNTD